MRDGDERHAEALLQLLQLELHALAQLPIECRERLVAKKHARADDDGARERHSLLLAAGELRRQPLLVARERHLAQRLAHARLDLARRESAHAQAEGNVLGHRTMREERIGLEDHRHVAPVHRRLGDVRAGDEDAAFVGRLEAGDDAQRRRLAAAARTKQREQLPRGDGEVDAVDGARSAVVALGDSLEPDVRRRGHGPRRPQALRMRATRASISSLRSLYHFQSTWMSCATFCSVL